MPLEEAARIVETRDTQFRVATGSVDLLQMAAMTSPTVFRQYIEASRIVRTARRR